MPRHSDFNHSRPQIDREILRRKYTVEERLQKIREVSDAKIGSLLRELEDLKEEVSELIKQQQL